MHFRPDRLFAPVLAVAAIAGCATATQTGAGASSSTSAAITAADLRQRVFIYADDSMKGRRAGTEGNMKATTYIANELRRIGVQPGGENGTYFQNVPMLHLTSSRTKPIIVDGRSFMPAKDYIGRTAKSFNNVQAIYGGVFGEASMIPPEAAVGKVVVLAVPKDDAGKPRWSGTRQPSSSRYPRAHSVAIVGMDGMVPSDWIPLMEEGGDVLNDPANPPDLSQLTAGLGFLYVTNAMGEAMMGGPLSSMQPGQAGRFIGGGMGYDTSRVVARNVIGIVQGSDPKLRGQYVAIGAHNDHVGTTSVVADHDSVKAFNMVALPQGADSQPRLMTPERIAEFTRILDSLRRVNRPKLDSVFNGADDDASGSMSVLEIAEAFQNAAVKPKRSIIFVWHTAEELGLFGSEYFTDHPTVPRDSIVAQLNLDMVGRGGAKDLVGRTSDNKDIWGGPDYVQLVGSRRLSTELGDLIEDVNRQQPRPMTFDYSIDANGHPANIYCRSDHYSYARFGIPVTFFTTGGHSDYHQVTDEPQYIEYDHMTRVAMLVKNAAERIANLDHRVVVDKPKPLPGARCVQ
ncbi:MAG TPA: M28 family peptidase [Gemmatimonadaceae bacterium]|nr:M28 family peptidase [Gemmatimonadaceae bacterium]